MHGNRSQDMPGIDEVHYMTADDAAQA